MSPEGPQDSPEVNPPTTISAVEPLPPGSNAEEVVDKIDERIRESWKQMDEDDDSGMQKGTDPQTTGADDSADVNDAESTNEPTA